MGRYSQFSLGSARGKRAQLDLYVKFMTNNLAKNAPSAIWMQFGCPAWAPLLSRWAQSLRRQGEGMTEIVPQAIVE
jgi:hypothetical protein